MFASWHVLGLPDRTTQVPWRPDGAGYWQAGESAGDRVAPSDGRHWSFLGVWPDEAAALAAEDELGARRPEVEAWHLHLRPVSGRGDVALAGGATPFAGLPRSARLTGPIAVLTLGVVRPEPAVVETFFAAAFGPVAGSLDDRPGCLARSNQRAVDMPAIAAFTLTVWDRLLSATAWAYGTGPHRAMMSRAADGELLAGSGFWRFAVLGTRGTVEGRDPLAGFGIAGATPLPSAG